MSDAGKIFVDAFRHLGGNRGVPPIDVRFYPYAGLRHTIRLRSGRCMFACRIFAKMLHRMFCEHLRGYWSLDFWENDSRNS